MGRRIEMGGGAMEDKYIREMDPKGEEPGIEVVAGYLGELFPNVKFENIATTNPNVKPKKGSKKMNVLGKIGGKPFLAMKVTSELRPGPRQAMMEEFKSEPFIETGFAEEDLARALIYVDPSEIAAVLRDKDMSKHPKLGEQILRSFEISLTIDLAKTEIREEKERLNKMLKDVEARQQELKSGKPTNPVTLN
jgi:hypothetical protein